jgi:SAM-dependent methyltransferase
MADLYVQYGCGLCSPEKWINFDASPTLRLQRIPLIGSVIRSRSGVPFPHGVRYGDIVKGLPIAENSCNGVYCSHVLEHLSLNDFRKALKNTYAILKPGGIFRCVLPDLEIAAREYVKALDEGNNLASIRFIERDTMLGQKQRPTGLKQQLAFHWGNARHLWMWDHASLSFELKEAGFSNIRKCKFADSSDAMFKDVEDEGRFWHAVAIECIK